MSSTMKPPPMLKRRAVILAALKTNPAGLSRSQLSFFVLSNCLAAAIQEALDELIADGLVAAEAPAAGKPWSRVMGPTFRLRT